MTEGLAALDDNECMILLVKRNGKWFTFQGHQEIGYVFDCEQTRRTEKLDRARRLKERLDLDDLPYVPF